MFFKPQQRPNQSRPSRRQFLAGMDHMPLERRDVPAVSIYAQVGQKVVANSYNVGCQMGRDVATDANGVSTVVWTDGATWTSGLDGDSFGIYARKIDANGVPVGSQFRVNQRTTGCQTNPVIGLDGAGNAVVAYSNCDFNGAAEYNNFSNYDVRVQRMNADNTRGAEIVIPLADNYITDPTPQIQVAADGSFTVAYRDGGSLCLRQYAADNTLVSSVKGQVGLQSGSGETKAASVPTSFRFAPDGTVMAITGVRFQKFIVDVGNQYQDRIAVDKLYSSGVVTQDIVYQSGWEDTAGWSAHINGSGVCLSIQPMPDGGYIWFNKLEDGRETLVAEKRDAKGAAVGVQTTIATDVSYTMVSTIVPGTSNVLVTYDHYTPWVGSDYTARILDSQANPLTDGFFLLHNLHGDAPKIAFTPGADKFSVTYDDEHPWLPSGDDSASGVPLIRFDGITPNSVLSFNSASDTASEGAGLVFGYNATINRTGELRAAPYSVLVTASSPDLPTSQFKPFQQVVEFGAGESSKTVNLKWIGDSVQTPTRHITLKLSDPTGTNASLGALTDFTLNLLDDDAPPNVAPTIQPIADKTIKAGETLKVQPVASDSNVPAQKLTFSLTSGPGDATIDPTTGAITWVGTESATPNLFQVKVTDNGSPALSASTSFHVTVNAAPNTAPVFQPISDKTVTAGGLLVVKATATDADVPAQKLTYSLDMAPLDATINPDTGEIRWTAPNFAETVTITVVVKDNGTPNYLDLTTFKVTVVPQKPNTAPVFQPIGNKTVMEGDLLIVQPTATDKDSPAQTLTYTLQSGPAGATINPQSGQVRWPAVYSAKPVVFKLLVTDNGTPALSSAATFQVTVQPRPVKPVSLSYTTTALGMDTLQMVFSGDVSSATASVLKNFRLVSAGKDKKLGTKDDVVAAIKSVGLVAGNPQAIRITLKTALPTATDDYLLTITGLKDTKGLLVDGDKNGSAGGTLTAYIRKGVVSV